MVQCHPCDGTVEDRSRGHIVSRIRTSSRDKEVGGNLIQDCFCCSQYLATFILGDIKENHEFLSLMVHKDSLSFMRP